MPTTSDGLTLYVPKGAPSPLEGVPVKDADLGYDHRHLSSADFYIDGDDQSAAIKGALLKKYGAPLEADESARRYKWSWPEQGGTINFDYQARTKRTTVTFSHDETAAPAPAGAKSLQETTAIAAGAALRRAARNPESLVIESGLASDDGKLLCIEYRAQNGFGGMNREFVAFQDGAAKSTSAFWNKHCLKPTTDVTNAVKLGVSMQ